jgi:HSP20 family protein
MRRLRREMNRLFDSSFQTSRAPAGYPAMNVWVSQDGAIVTAELPGVDPDDIDISVTGDTLTVSGCHNPDLYQEGESYHRKERGCGKFSRSFQLPFQVAPEGVTAGFENGVLNIDLPRTEADKPKKIEVKAG